MLSSNNQVEYERQRHARQVPHYSLRKLNIGVASVLLATTFFMGRAHADVLNNQPTDTGNVSTSVQVTGDSGGGAVATPTTDLTPAAPVENTVPETAPSAANVTPTVGTGEVNQYQPAQGVKTPVQSYAVPTTYDNVSTGVVATSVTPEMVNGNGGGAGEVQTPSHDMNTQAANDQIAAIMAQMQQASFSPLMNLVAVNTASTQGSLSRTINIQYPNDNVYYGSKSTISQTAEKSGNNEVFSAVSLDTGEGWLVPQIDSKAVSEVPSLVVSEGTSLTDAQKTVKVTFSTVASRTVTLTTIYDLPDGTQSSTVLSAVQKYERPQMNFPGQDTSLKHYDFYKPQIDGKDVNSIPAVWLDRGSKQNIVIEVKYVPVTYKVRYTVVDDEIDTSKDAPDAKDPTVTSGVIDVPAKDLETWQPPVPTGYVVNEVIQNPGGVGGVKFTYTVRVGHKTEQVTRSHVVTRTVTIVKPDGTSSMATQTVKLVQTGSQDMIIKQPKWGPAPESQFDAIEVPEISGYQPSILEVPAEIVNMQSKDSTIKVTYTKVDSGSEATHNYRVVVIDVDGGNKTLSTQETNKLFNNFESYIPQNYQLAEYALDGTSLTVKVRHELVGVNDTPKTVTRVIHMNMPYNQSQTGSQSITFGRTGTKDMVTGQIKWNPWDPASYTFPEVDSPVLTGWKADGNVPTLTVTPESSDTEVTINYTQTTMPPSQTPSDVTSEPSHRVTPSHVMTSADYVSEFNSMANLVSGGLKLGYTSQHGYNGAGFDVVWYEPSTSQVVQTGFLNFTDRPVQVQGATNVPTTTKSLTRLINLHYADGGVRTIKQTVTIPLRNKIIFHGNGQATTSGDPFVGYKAFDAYNVPGHINEEALTKQIPEYTISSSTFKSGKDTATITYDVNYKSTLPASSTSSQNSQSASMSSANSSASSSASQSSNTSSVASSTSQNSSASSNTSTTPVESGVMSVFNSLANMQKSGNPKQLLGYTSIDGDQFNAVIYEGDTGQVVMTGKIDTKNPSLDDFIAVPPLGTKTYHRRITLKFVDGSSREITQHITLTAGPAQFFDGNGKALETRDVLIGQTLFDQYNVPGRDGETPDVNSLPAIVVTAADLQPGGRLDHDGAMVSYTVNYHQNGSDSNAGSQTSNPGSQTSSANSSASSMSSNVSSASNVDSGTPSASSTTSNASSMNSNASSTNSSAVSNVDSSVVAPSDNSSAASNNGSNASSVTSNVMPSDNGSSASSNSMSNSGSGMNSNPSSSAEPNNGSSASSSASNVNNGSSANSNALSANNGSSASSDNRSDTSNASSGNDSKATSSVVSNVTSSNGSNTSSVSSNVVPSNVSGTNSSVGSNGKNSNVDSNKNSNVDSKTNSNASASASNRGSKTSSAVAGNGSNAVNGSMNDGHTQTAALFGGNGGAAGAGLINGNATASGNASTGVSTGAGNTVGTVAPTAAAGAATIGGGAASNSAGAGSASGALPQTGSRNGELLAAVGLAAGGLALGMASLETKRREN